MRTGREGESRHAKVTQQKQIPGVQVLICFPPADQAGGGTSGVLEQAGLPSGSEDPGRCAGLIDCALAIQSHLDFSLLCGHTSQGFQNHLSESLLSLGQGGMSVSAFQGCPNKVAEIGS